jgi:hypothetical protein
MTENGSNGVSIRQRNKERDKIKHSIPISNRKTDVKSKYI